jgi:hypothetical protein
MACDLRILHSLKGRPPDATSTPEKSGSRPLFTTRRSFPAQPHRRTPGRTRLRAALPVTQHGAVPAITAGQTTTLDPRCTARTWHLPGVAGGRRDFEDRAAAKCPVRCVDGLRDPLGNHDRRGVRRHRWSDRHDRCVGGTKCVDPLGGAMRVHDRPRDWGPPIGAVAVGWRWEARLDAITSASWSFSTAVPGIISSSN